MNRRSFLSTLLGGATTLALDPERALWVPGAKTIFIPPAPRTLITLEDWARHRAALDPHLRRIVELLTQSNEIIDDMVLRDGGRKAPLSYALLH